MEIVVKQAEDRAGGVLAIWYTGRVGIQVGLVELFQ